MAVAICSECGCPIEYTECEEWAYCPICENDQVEIKKREITIDCDFSGLIKNEKVGGKNEYRNIRQRN